MAKLPATTGGQTIVFLIGILALSHYIIQWMDGLSFNNDVCLM